MGGVVGIVGGVGGRKSSGVTALPSKYCCNMGAYGPASSYPNLRPSGVPFIRKSFARSNLNSSSILSCARCSASVANPRLSSASFSNSASLISLSCSKRSSICRIAAASLRLCSSSFQRRSRSASRSSIAFSGNAPARKPCPAAPTALGIASTSPPPIPPRISVSNAISFHSLWDYVVIRCRMRRKIRFRHNTQERHTFKPCSTWGTCSSWCALC